MTDKTLEERFEAFNKRPSPHFFTRNKTNTIMAKVLLALCLPAAAGVYYFGLRVILMILVGAASSVFFEWLYVYIKRDTLRINDLSAVVTGVLIGLSLPVTAPLFTIVIGSAIAILLVKMPFGGSGKNPFNPAVAARVSLKLFFSPWITNWVLPLTPSQDVVTTATPLESIGHFASSVPAGTPSLWELFIGHNLGGPVGETCKLALLLAMLYLIFQKIINPWIPLLYMATLMVTVAFFSEKGFDLQFMLTHLLSGSAIFVAVFMATDYSSGALTPNGQKVFGIGCGLLTGLIRMLLNLPGGAGIAVLVMNASVPLLDKWFAPRIYGHKKSVSHELT